MQKIGVLSSLIRYPVKSFGGEYVESTKVFPYGVYGDRSHVIMDDRRKGKYLTITQHQEMATYKASFVGEESEEAYPEVQVRTPNGGTYSWNDESFRQEFSGQSGRNLSFHSFTPSYVPLGAIEEAPLLLVTNASLQYLSSQLGKKSIDVQRFRPNFIIDTIQETPFLEQGWISMRIQIGEEVVLEVTKSCERCMIITVDPENGEKDPSIHREVIRMNNNYFGIYAKVIQTGRVKLGDEVWMVKE